MVAGIFGAAVRPPADWRGHLLLLMLIGYVCALHTLSFGHSRYHLPLIPPILVYAGLAIVHRRELWSRRGTWPFVLACALVGLLAAGWAREILVVDLGRFVDAVRSST